MKFLATPGLTLAPLAPLVQASPYSENLALRQASTDIHGLIGEADILEAFRAAGHPSAQPKNEWHFGNGTDQYLYDFDTEEWNGMYSQLVFEATGFSPASPLMVRDLTRDDFSWICTDQSSRPWAYYFTLNAVVSSICTGFGYGVEYTGRTQVIERYGLNDIRGRRIRAIFKYTWNFTKYASITSCSTAITYGLGEFCKVSS